MKNIFFISLAKIDSCFTYLYNYNVIKMQFTYKERCIATINDHTMCKRKKVDNTVHLCGIHSQSFNQLYALNNIFACKWLIFTNKKFMINCQYTNIFDDENIVDIMKQTFYPILDGMSVAEIVFNMMFLEYECYDDDNMTHEIFKLSCLSHNFLKSYLQSRTSETLDLIKLDYKQQIYDKFLIPYFNTFSNHQLLMHIMNKNHFKLCYSIFDEFDVDMMIQYYEETRQENDDYFTKNIDKINNQIKIVEYVFAEKLFSKTYSTIDDLANSKYDEYKMRTYSNNIMRLCYNCICLDISLLSIQYEFHRMGTLKIKRDVTSNIFGNIMKISNICDEIYFIYVSKLIKDKSEIPSLFVSPIWRIFFNFHDFAINLNITNSRIYKHAYEYFIYIKQQLNQVCSKDIVEFAIMQFI